MAQKYLLILFSILCITYSSSMSACQEDVREKCSNVPTSPSNSKSTQKATNIDLPTPLLDYTGDELSDDNELDTKKCISKNINTASSTITLPEILTPLPLTHPMQQAQLTAHLSFKIQHFQEQEEQSGINTLKAMVQFWNNYSQFFPGIDASITALLFTIVLINDPLTEITKLHNFCKNNCYQKTP